MATLSSFDRVGLVLRVLQQPRSLQHRLDTAVPPGSCPQAPAD
ncbi:hypothetical protein [uncultured Hymenobacter sp.]